MNQAASCPVKQPFVYQMIQVVLSPRSRMKPLLYKASSFRWLRVCSHNNRSEDLADGYFPEKSDNCWRCGLAHPGFN